jgi:hypothetical protein
MKCPHCNKDLGQDDFNICPFCTKPLKGAPASQPPVVVQLHKEKKRRFNPIWLLVILLLLLVCCCGLLLTDIVRMPEFIAPYIEPYLEGMRNAFGGFIDGGMDGPPIDEDNICKDLRDQLENVTRDGVVNDPQNPDNLKMDVKDIGNLKDPELWYQWEDGEKIRAVCEDKGNFLTCTIPNPKGIQQKLKFWIAQDDCEDELGFVEWDEEGKVIDHIFQLTGPSSECCPELEVTYTGYINPKVLRLLEIDLECEDGAWNIEEGDILDGEVLIGEDQSIHWTDVSCELSDGVLHCESPDTVDQKRSWSKVELFGDDCTSEAYFPSPYYEQAPPSEGESCPPGCECSPGSPPYCPDESD